MSQAPLDLDFVPPRSRRLFANRTLNLRSIKAVGFDMDYTLVHYHVDAWERRAYAHAREELVRRGLPVADLDFVPDRVAPGLVLDLELGNVVKANRFGYVTRAAHGTRMLDFDEQRARYSRVLVALEEPRWVFLNTLFGLSEGTLWLQCVELLDQGKVGAGLGYAGLYREVRAALDVAHTEGAVKAEILRNPSEFVMSDAELPLALLDLRSAGKLTLLVTNSEWDYTQRLLRYSLEQHLPAGTSWRSLFDLVIVQARKPTFFTADSPAFEVVDDAGLLRPLRGPLQRGGAYLGGHAGLVERDLGLAAEEILYFGDHPFADVHVSKSVLAWRTGLVLRQLEDELEAIAGFAPRAARLGDLMTQKERLEWRTSWLRLALQRREQDYGPQPREAPEELRHELSALRAQLADLDAEIGPLARASAELVSARWGPLLRAGNDKSHLARQIERHADVYTSRVSNLLYATPFEFLRAPRSPLPHDP